MIHPTRRLRRAGAVAIAVATAAAAALLSPASSAAAGSPLTAATLVCHQAGGTFTTPGSGEIFACTFPSSVNVLDIYGTPLLLYTLPNLCFAAGGETYGPVVDENALACFA
jgi:hypothetical protein